MKKILSAAVCLILTAGLLCVPAAAENTDLTGYSIANGTVQAASWDDVTAPYSGTVLPFDWETGDAVESGATLFEMMTTDVTAPEAGTIRYLFAKAGDSSEAAMATYGAVLAMQPSSLKRISCTYRGAYNSNKTKHLHVGDKVWFKVGSDKGEGVVTSVKGSKFIVEITDGSFGVGKTADVFINSKRRNEDKCGTGKVYQRDDLMIKASGRISEMLVSVGDKVKKGDVLLRVMSADADAGASPVISSPAGGVVGTLGVSPGQQVWKGQLLCQVLHSDDPEVVAQVDEMDLGDLQVGDRLPVTLDTNESKVLTGTVTEISALGVTRQNAAYYTVHLSVPGGGLMLGQSASVYLPKK